MANRNSTASEPAGATPSIKTYRLQLPYGELRVTEKEAYDHTRLRARQLNGLMLLMTGDGHEVFEGLNMDMRGDLLWHAQQLAQEVYDMLPIVSSGDLTLKKEMEVQA